MGQKGKIWAKKAIYGPKRQDMGQEKQGMGHFLNILCFPPFYNIWDSLLIYSYIFSNSKENIKGSNRIIS